jgi:hypothetical protein
VSADVYTHKQIRDGQQQQQQQREQREFVCKGTRQTFSSSSFSFCPTKGAAEIDVREKEKRKKKRGKEKNFKKKFPRPYREEEDEEEDSRIYT